MAYTSCIHLANFNLAPTISRSQDPRRRPNMMNPANSKLVCRAQNGDGEVQVGVNRKLVYQNLVVASAAIGSALSAFVSPTNVSDEEISFDPWPPGKKSWPELVGEKGDVAVATIKKENPYMNPILLPEGSPTTRDFVRTRVWVFVNEEGVVTQVPFAT